MMKMTVMNVRRVIPGTALAAAAALLLGATSACSSASSAADQSGKLSVVAAFYPLQFLAERIGGDQVAVTTLTHPGQEPHDLEISAKQTAQLQDSDVPAPFGWAGGGGGRAGEDTAGT